MKANHRVATPVGRRGVTLQELLGAMFIAELGLVSLLTLFSSDMADMAQAMRDCRNPKLVRLADEVLYVTDDILLTSEIAFEDLAAGDISGASALSKQFAIHDQQLTALIESLTRSSPTSRTSRTVRSHNSPRRSSASGGTSCVR